MTEITVQVVPAETAEAELGFGFGGRRPAFQDRVDELGDSLNEIAERLRTRLPDLAQNAELGWDLDQVTLSFSLDLQAEAGVILARASSKAGFQATLTWKRSVPAER
jgi:Trypsin-co-occurring domain 1